MIDVTFAYKMRNSSRVALTIAQNLLRRLLGESQSVNGLVRPTDKRQIDQPQPLLDNE